MDNVKQIQSRLREIGFDPGPIDGEIGPRTERAIRNFQIVKGLEVDGIVGPITRRALGLDQVVKVASDPAWMTIARGYLGMREIVGPKHNPEVVEFWQTAKVPGVNDDETPWCAAFVSAVLEEAGVRSQRTGWARGYLRWGVSSKPFVGAVVVFERGPKAGHVGFLAGHDRSGNLMILGGNQNNRVSIAPFGKVRVLRGGYRAPKGFQPASYDLPILDGDGRLSRNEA